MSEYNTSKTKEEIIDTLVNYLNHAREDYIDACNKNYTYDFKITRQAQYDLLEDIIISLDIERGI